MSDTYQEAKNRIKALPDTGFFNSSYAYIVNILLILVLGVLITLLLIETSKLTYCVEGGTVCCKEWLCNTQDGKTQTLQSMINKYSTNCSVSYVKDTKTGVEQAILNPACVNVYGLRPSTGQ